MAVWRSEPEASPESVGMDASVLDALVAEFEKTVEQGELFHGAQLAVYRRGVRVLEAGGGLARVRTRVPVTPESLFVIFSATKGLAGLAMLMLYERGAFHYDEPVVKYWPEFADVFPEKRQITIRHVMSHRAGFPLGPKWLNVDHWGDREAIRRAMIEVPLRFAPGEKNAYHAMNYGHMVNELLSRIDGRDCGQFLREEVFAPLGLCDLYVGLPDDAALEARVAWCYHEIVLNAARATGVVGPAPSAGADAVLDAPELTEKRAIPPQYRDTPELAHDFNRPETHRAVLPAGGGIAAARDLAAVYAVLAQGGSGRGVSLVSADGLAQVTSPTNRPGDIDSTIGFPMRWGLGFHMGTHGRGSTIRTFGHGGAGGQIGFADPDRELAFAFLTNGELSPDFVVWRYRLQGLAFKACIG
ncbi:MAG: beta-lactamase family protein [Deltaproteobacteria bacterium]|nr:MAG: beta-lactamase family protein [Deltaproteobacteria bacterium]